MTPREIRNNLLGEHVVKALESRNMEAYYVCTKEEALKKALELMKEGSSVGWGGSASIEEIGLKSAVRNGDYNLLDREAAKTPEESNRITHEVLSCDYFLTSSNAVSEDGILVNIDGNANRIAAICYGPKYVIMVVGVNKIVKSEADALSRARNEAAPVNAQRFGLDTPCSKTGCCYDCKSPDTVCCQFLTTRYSKAKNRIKVILVGEELGF